MTNDELIARAEAALDGVTDGPWEVKCLLGVTQLIMDGDAQMGDEAYYPWVPVNLKDWEFFAAARDLVPDLYAALKASEARVKELEGEQDRLLYVLAGVAGAIDTGRNEPLAVWRDQIRIALEALKGGAE